MLLLILDRFDFLQKDSRKRRVENVTAENVTSQDGLDKLVKRSVKYFIWIRSKAIYF